MSKVVVLNHLTLDGVMQAPGRPDEDRRDGFAHGDSVGEALGDIGEVGGLLFGRRTYEDFFSLTRQPRPPRTGGRSCSCTTNSCR
jgi:hypothetical protein